MTVTSFLGTLPKQMEEIFPKLPAPASIPVADTFIVSATLDAAAARTAVEHAVRDGLLRPFDIQTAEIEDPRALWVPFWRLRASVDGLFLGTTTVDGRSVPIGTRSKEAALIVCARSTFPYESRLPSSLGRTIRSGGIEIEGGDLEPLVDPSILSVNDAEIVDADVDRDRAISLGTGILLGSVSPTHAFHSRYESKIESATYCYYPIYYARYRYSGEASRRGEEQLFVAVSGKTGRAVSARYPSSARALAAKLRRFLSFDRRIR